MAVIGTSHNSDNTLICKQPECIPEYFLKLSG